MKLVTLSFFSLVFAASTALAGPPLVCERIQIGNAKSLPWKDVKGWNGADPSYNVASLTADTLAILTPSAPLPVRMETLRRAVIYSARSEAATAQLTSHLLARVADWEAAGKPASNAWFDAGYFVETLRQAAFIYRYDMLTPVEKAQWQHRGDFSLDGKPWLEQAIRLGGKGMAVALAKVEEYRKTDLQRTNKLVSSK